MSFLGGFRRPEKKPAGRSSVVMLLPLTSHEAETIAEVISAIRGGRAETIEKSLLKLQDWDARRAFVAMRTLANRYIHATLDSVGQEDGQAVRDIGAETLVERIQSAIPDGVRLPTVSIFNATVLSLAAADFVEGEVSKNPAEAVVALAYVVAGCASIVYSVQGNKEKTLKSMLHGISAPW